MNDLGYLFEASMDQRLTGIVTGADYTILTSEGLLRLTTDYQLSDILTYAHSLIQ